MGQGTRAIQLTKIAAAIILASLALLAVFLFTRAESNSATSLETKAAESDELPTVVEVMEQAAIELSEPVAKPEDIKEGKETSGDVDSGPIFFKQLPPPTPTPPRTPTPLPAPTEQPATAPKSIPASAPEPTAEPTAVQAPAPVAEPTAVPVAPVVQPTAVPAAPVVQPTAVPAAPVVQPTVAVVSPPATEPTVVANSTQPLRSLPSAYGSVAEMESFVFAEVNRLRAEAGVAAITLDPAISSLAREWSQTQAEAKRMYHRSPESLSAGMPAGWQRWTENVATGPNVEWAMTGLIRSSGHMQNMVDPSLNKIGVGVAVAADGSVYVTQNFGTY